jgi:hypothetical protein
MGRFDFTNVRHGKYVLIAEYNGLRPSSAHSLEIRPGSSTDRALGLREGHTVNVEVRDSYGEAIEGATLNLTNVTPFFVSSELPKKRIPHITNARGEATIPNVDKRFATLEITADGFAKQSRSITIDLDQPSSRVAVTMRRPVTLTGRVLSRTTLSPLAQASISLMREPSNAGEAHLTISTDKEGRFTATGVDPGNFRLFISMAEHSRLETKIRVSEGIGELNLGDLLLDGLVKLTVTVLDADGMPVPGLIVSRGEYRYLESNGAGSSIPMPNVNCGVTGENGVVTANNLESGKISLQVNREGLVVHFKDVVDMQQGPSFDVTLHLPRALAKLELRLLETDGATKDFGLRRIGHSHQYRFATATDAGELIMADIPPGSYELVTYISGVEKPRILDRFEFAEGTVVKGSLTVPPVN